MPSSIGPSRRRGSGATGGVGYHPLRRVRAAACRTMSSEMNYEPCIDYVLASGEDDWVPFGVVVYVARTIGGATDEQAQRTLVLALVEQLLDRGLMEVGDCANGPFVAWGLSKEEMLRRISHEWSILRHPPRPGEVCWLSNTPAGDDKARSRSS